MNITIGTGSFVLDLSGYMEVRALALSESGIPGYSAIQVFDVDPAPVDYDMAITPVFGPEEEVYLRLIYGTASQAGVPTGIFYDLRAIPLPYTPKRLTPLAVVFGTSYLGQTHVFTVTRENPGEDRPSVETFQVTPDASSQTSTLRVGLTQGLNIITVTVNGNNVYTWNGTARNYATLLTAIAEQISGQVTESLQALTDSVYSLDSTRFADIYLGETGKLFPHQQILNRMVAQLWLSGRMNNPGSTGGVLDIGSMTGSTPWLRQQDVTWDISNPWLRPMHGADARVDQELWLAAPTDHESRIRGLPAFALARGLVVESGETWHRVAGQDHRVLVTDDSDLLEFPEPEEWAEIKLQTMLQLMPEPGAYVIPCIVSVEADSLTSVYYTTDGSTPTTDSPQWVSDLPLLHTQTITVRGIKSGEADVILRHKYTVVYPVPSANNSMLSYDPTSGTAAAHSGYGWMAGSSVPAPTFSPVAGLFNSAIGIEILAAVGRVIRYTTNGTTPTESSALYTVPITLSSVSTVIKAASFSASGGGRSEIAAGEFRVLPIVATPESIIINDSVSVTLAGPSGLPIYYALDDHDVYDTDRLYIGQLNFTRSTQVSVAVVTPDAGAAPTRLLEYTVVTIPNMYPTPGSYLKHENTRLDVLSDPKVTSVDPLVVYTLDGSNPGLASTQTTEVSLVPDHRLLAVPSGVSEILTRSVAGDVMSPVAGGTYNYHDALAVSHDVHWYNPVTGRYGYFGYKSNVADTKVGFCEFDPQYLTDVDTTTPANNTTRFEYGAYTGYTNTVAFGNILPSIASIQNVAVDEVTGTVYVSYNQDIGNSSGHPRHGILSLNPVTGAASHAFLSDPTGTYYGNAIKWTYETPTAMCFNPETGTVIAAVMKTDNTASGGFQQDGAWYYPDQGGVSSFFMRSLSPSSSSVWGTTWYWTIDENVVNRWSATSLFHKGGMFYGIFEVWDKRTYSTDYTAVISRVQAAGFTQVLDASTSLANMLKAGMRDQYPATTASVVCDASGALWFIAYLYNSEMYGYSSKSVAMETYAPNFTAANSVIWYRQGTNVVIRVPPTLDSYTVVDYEPSPTVMYDGYRGGVVLRRSTGSIVLRGFKQGLKSGVSIPNRSSVFTVF